MTEAEETATKGHSTNPGKRQASTTMLSLLSATKKHNGTNRAHGGVSVYQDTDSRLSGVVVQARGFNGAEPENSIVWSYTTLHNSPTHDAAPPAQADPIEFSDDDEPSQDTVISIYQKVALLEQTNADLLRKNFTLRLERDKFSTRKEIYQTRLLEREGQITQPTGDSLERDNTIARLEGTVVENDGLLQSLEEENRALRVEMAEGIRNARATAFKEMLDAVQNKVREG